MRLVEGCKWGVLYTYTLIQVWPVGNQQKRGVSYTSVSCTETRKWLDCLWVSLAKFKRTLTTRSHFDLQRLGASLSSLGLTATE